MEARALSLYELNSLVCQVLRQTLDEAYWVEAEISEARRSGGHLYLELVQKDASGNKLLARARATLWARTYAFLVPLFERATGERLRAGLRVRLQVAVEFHELYGYALNILDIDSTFTLGDLVARRREILSRLDADGILGDNQQLPMPSLLKHIAVVSSVSAAGYGDFCHQLLEGDHGLHFEVRLFPAVMQGTNVEESVMAALAAIADEAHRWDCVVIIRGGGSTSDLADFDSYPLAAAVAQMPLPVIVGIGHERDETVLDFVAHTRVKTPTAAAAFLIDHGLTQLSIIDNYHRTIVDNARQQLQHSQLRLQQLTTLLPHILHLIGERHHTALRQLIMRLSMAPQRRLADAQGALPHVQLRIEQAVARQLERSGYQLQTLSQHLQLLDPQCQLRRGFSLTYTADGRLLRSVADVHIADVVTTRLADGTFTSSASSEGSLEETKEGQNTVR